MPAEVVLEVAAGKRSLGLTPLVLLPESQEVYRVVVEFFARHLGTRPNPAAPH
jgi:hypothetical protein